MNKWVARLLGIDKEAYEKYAYGSDITAAILHAATSGESAHAAAEATVAGIIGRAFAVAEVRGPAAFLFPADVMVTIGRELVLHGESVWTRENGALRWHANYNYTKTGDYFFDDTKTTATRDTVFHPMYAIDRVSMRGLSPIGGATRIRDLLRQSESGIEQESTASSGYFLPTPLKGDKLTGFGAAIKNLKGKMGLVETTAGGWGDKQNAPKSDYEQRRFGFDPSMNALAAYKDAHIKALAVMGVPAAVVEPTDAASMREGWRILLHSLLQPLAAITVSASASADMDIDIRFDKLMASDISGRARAFGSLLANGEGLEVEDAARIAGLDIEVDS